MKRSIIALAFAAMMAFPACAPKDAAPVKKDMCVQMYSARSILNTENYADILKTVAAMGYTAVETANYDGDKGLIYGDTPEVFKQKVDVKPLKDYPIDAVYGKVLKAPKDYTDVRGQVTADYQDMLEKEWVARLREKYPVEVYDSVVATVNKH